MIISTKEGPTRDDDQIAQGRMDGSRVLVCKLGMN